jgi:hypothetical protein
MRLRRTRSLAADYLSAIGNRTAKVIRNFQIAKFIFLNLCSFFAGINFYAYFWDKLKFGPHEKGSLFFLGSRSAARFL